MSEREIREALAAQITQSTVDRFLRHQSLRQDEGESFEFEELHREEAILELAQRLGVTDERAEALWTVAEEKLVRASV